MVAKNKGAGGNLTRTQVVTIRLDPKLKFAAELAARKQRRTLSSFIEWAIEETLDDYIIEGEMGAPTAMEAMRCIWDVREEDRFVNFAIKCPSLLNHQEELIWKIIYDEPYFWSPTRYGEKSAFSKEIADVFIHYERVREQWDNLHKIITDELSVNDIPEIVSARSK